MHIKKVRKIILSLLLFLPSLFVFAKSNLDIPSSLAPWQGWVLHGVEEELCPVSYNNAEQHWCVWPSKLSLTLEPTHGKFTLEAAHYNKGWVPLPGDDEVWPEKVKVNNKPNPVGLFQGRPAVYLEPGDYHIEGEWHFDKLPDNLTIPPTTGIVSLILEGKEIAQPDRDKIGKIWLRKPIQAQTEAEAFSFKVFKLIEDEIPLIENTLLRLTVSGQPREVSIGPVLDANTLPMAVRSPLPGKLEENGMLRLQIKPGTWDIMIQSRNVKRQDILSVSKHQSPWPNEEVWSVKMNPSLRLIDIEGAPSLDPQQTQMPPEWKNYPAFLLQEGKQLKLVEKRRGIETHQIEQLNLQRNMWLDFSGKMLTIKDNLTGNVQNHWRLQVDKNTHLGRVNIDGQDKLITKLSPQDPDGVEIRQGQLNLTAVSQVSKGVKLSAVGWDFDVQSLSTLLYLPPGWKLLGARGVDKVTDAWLEDWSLLDLFLVFVIAASVMKLCGKKWACIALVTLALIYHEKGAPLYSWLNIIASIALLNVIPDGTFKKWMRRYYYLSFVVLIVVSLPFLIKQVREAIYPQLSVTYTYPPLMAQAGGRLEQEVSNAAMGPKSRALLAVPARKMGAVLAQASPVAHAPVIPLEDYDPNAKVQSGPGVPDWQWEPHQLNWNGPVLKDQILSLWILPASLVSILKLLQVALVLLLIYGLSSFRTKPEKEPNSSALTQSRVSSFSWLWFLPFLALLSGTPHSLFAQDSFPNDKLLDDLRERLLEPPGCLPDCAEISRMQIDIKLNQLTVRMMAQAVTDTAIPLPSTLAQWMPQTVLVDGQAQSNLLFSENQQLMLKLSQGVHEVILTGPIGLQDKFEISVPLVPKTVEATTEGWNVEGIFRQKLQGQNVYFSRLKPMDQKNQLLRFEPGRIPSFVRLQRTLRLGLDWEMVSEVTRLSPNQGAINLTIPLLPDEAILSDKVEVKDGNAFIVLNGDEQRTLWKSKLKIVPQLNLTALATPNVKEVWQLEAVSQWHCDFHGIPVIHQQDPQGKWLPTWEPWPNEKVSIDITRPEGVAGATLTIENSRLQVSPGKRATENTLRYTMRANLGGTHSVEIPSTAEIKEILINGERQPLSAEQGKITLPVNPGMQDVEISWRAKDALRTFFKTPRVKLNEKNTNSIIDLQISKDRWILGLGGPLFGPAVLFWGMLVVVALLSFGLGKSKLTPLNVIQWFLLATGLLVASPWAVVCAVAWFVALDQRKHLIPSVDLYTFRFIQVGCILLTIVFAVSLFTSISHGLLGVPNMQLGAPSTSLIESHFDLPSVYQLQWYQDTNSDLLPRAWVFSLPLLVYRLLMLVWALWLALSLLKWMRWGWDCFASQGLWQQSNPIK